MSEQKSIENPFATHGAISWAELASTDPEKSVEFYSNLFSWGIETMETPNGPYTCMKVGDVKIAGIMKTPCEDAEKAMWGNYVTVDDIEATKEKVEELGGKPLCDVMHMPGVGKMFGFVDPQGAIISAIQYEEGSSDC